MSVVTFPGNKGPEEPPKAEKLVWFCKCGCSSFELSSDGTTECVNCGTISTSADDDAAWFMRKPPVPDATKEFEGTEIMITAIHNSPEALKRVLASASHDDTALVAVVRKNGSIKTWKSGEFDQGDEVSWLDESLATVRSMWMPVGVPADTLDTLRAHITNSRELQSVIVIRQDGDVSAWVSSLATIETPHQVEWLDRHLAMARELVLERDPTPVPPEWKDEEKAKLDD